MLRLPCLLCWAATLPFLVTAASPANEPSAEEGPEVPEKVDTGVYRQVGFTARKDPKATTQILRTADDLKKIPAAFQAVAKTINLDAVDFTKQMVVIIAAGQTNASFGVRITVDKLEPAKNQMSATIHWTYRPYYGGAAPLEESGNPSGIAVVKRFDGEVKFEKTVFRFPEGEALPPSAGPPPENPGGPGGPRPG